MIFDDKIQPTVIISVNWPAQSLLRIFEKSRASLRLIVTISEIGRLLSEARKTADFSTQEVNDSTEMLNKKRFRKQVPTPINNVKPMFNNLLFQLVQTHHQYILQEQPGGVFQT